MLTENSIRVIGNKQTSISPEWEQLYNDKKICGVVCRTDSLITIVLEKQEVVSLVAELLDHRARITIVTPEVKNE